MSILKQHIPVAASGPREVLARITAEQMVALEAAIKEEHMARWNPAICQVRKPRKKEGEVGFAAAVLERITKQWPDLHSWLLSTDVDLIKKHIWKETKGKCPHEVTAAAQANEAAQQQAATEEAAATVLNRIPNAAGATWEQLKEFMTVVDADISTGNVGEWKGHDGLPATRIINRCGSWKLQQQLTQAQQKEIVQFETRCRMNFF
ncbi:hypothetical protein CHLNCDRAFT_135065 [Chlorella variabilis]|uniref:Uncharacterized protein n=1 Tax=Chlorella variabilis TaxID=554065 RepID=E1ZUA4_CHLVA|nr:hypothetical protein CHLNCDRAFT_135065 [Chlorella variabilis]EFN50591.1 hypothetical protein CHLNCDRAFT_135065 [Chlorella variabilis]|eukprot:XP_005842716.1 hypothetical protein CHLNCDRAFT_135065 [Chlorella variabilis]